MSTPEKTVETKLWKSDTVWKLIVGAFAAGGIYAGVNTSIERLESKIDKLIAVQGGRDQIQDLKHEDLREDVDDVTIRLDKIASREGIKPKSPKIEQED